MNTGFGSHALHQMTAHATRPPSRRVLVPVPAGSRLSTRPGGAALSLRYRAPPRQGYESVIWVGPSAWARVPKRKCVYFRRKSSQHNESRWPGFGENEVVQNSAPAYTHVPFHLSRCIVWVWVVVVSVGPTRVAGDGAGLG